MRIAIITPSFSPQKTPLAETLSSVCLGLVKKGHSIGLFVPDYIIGKTLAKNLPGIQVFIQPSLPNPLGRDQPVFSGFPTQIISQILSFAPNIVLYVHPTIHIAPQLSAVFVLKKIPMVSLYFPPLSKITAFFVALLSRRSVQTITSTPSASDYLSKFGLKNKVVIIPPNSKNLVAQYEQVLAQAWHTGQK